MKHRHLILRLAAGFLAAFVLLCAGASWTLHAQSTNAPAAVATDAAASGSLVPNGDFESAPADAAWPVGWVPAKGVSWESENGKHFLRLVAVEPGKMLMAYSEIDIPSGVKNLTITIRYRTSGVSVGAQNWYDARAIFHFIDSNRKQLAPEPGVLIFSKDASDWTTASEQVTVPDTAAKMMLIPCLFQVKSGTLDLAKVNVTASSQ